jgi:hypothetical protein
MNIAKYTIRVFLLFLIVLIVIYLNLNTDENLNRIVKFKIGLLERMAADSSVNQSKFDELLGQTTKFSRQIMEDTSHTTEAAHYLSVILGLLIVSELTFWMLKGRFGSK